MRTAKFLCAAALFGLLPTGCDAAPATDAPAKAPAKAIKTVAVAPPPLAPPQTDAALSQAPRALWVWDASVISDAKARAALFEFCARKNVSVIYQSVGDIFAPTQFAPDDARHITAPQLSAFVEAARVRQLRVEALDGDPQFALSAHHAEALGILNKALDYNAAATPKARLDGFQWDTEPYVLPAFSQGAEQKQAVFTQFLDSMKEMRDAVQKRPTLRLSFCIPWFFDLPENELAWNGATKAPAFHLIDLLQSLPEGEMVLMSYRDRALGANGTIEISRGEIEYAAQSAPQVRVWIGQETQDVKGDPPSITFYQEGESALNEAMRQIETAYAKAPGFGGVAIHFYNSYSDLKPGDPVIEKPAMAPSDALKVLLPTPNAKVARETLVSGVAPRGGRGVKVSVAVKPQGDTWYDQGEAPLEADGSWSVRALFGGENTPAGAVFEVRARLLAEDGSVVEEQTVNVVRTEVVAP